MPSLMLTAESGRLTYGNITNQKISFLSAIIACKILDATLVVPEWHRGDQQYVPLASLWDADHFLRQAAAERVDVLLPASSGSRKWDCKGGSQSFATRLERFGDGRENVLCVTPYEMFYELWKQNLTEQESKLQGGLLMHQIIAGSQRFAEARRWLKPSRRLARRARLIVDRLVPRGEQFFGVHLRIEEDFVHACSVWKTRINDTRCFLQVQEIAEQLQRKGVLKGSLLYVFPPRNLKAMSALCGHVYRCIQRESVDPGGDLAYNEVALLDFAVVEHASGAFGNVYSTMSVELVASAHADAKPGAFLNFPCPSQPSSLHHAELFCP